MSHKKLSQKLSQVWKRKNNLYNEVNIYIYINRNVKVCGSWHSKDRASIFVCHFVQDFYESSRPRFMNIIHRQIFKLVVLRGRLRSVCKYSWPVSDGTRGDFFPTGSWDLLLTLLWVLVSLGLTVNFSPFKFYNICSHATSSVRDIDHWLQSPEEEVRFIRITH